MGAGINLFKQLFPESYYAYQTATLISSKPVSKKIYDSDNNVIAEYPLGSDELRGILKVENGQLVAYGDIKPSDGNGTEVFDIVDLGTLDWGYDSIYQYFGVYFDDWSGRDYTIICSNYVYMGSASTESMLNKDSGTMWNWGTALKIKDTNYTDAATFKTAMSGVYLIYEKATPTAKSYTPFTNPMISGSTEEFTDTRSVKMFCGHDSLYYTSNFKYW